MKCRWTTWRPSGHPRCDSRFAGTRELETAVVVDGVERPVHMVGVTEGYQTIPPVAHSTGTVFRCRGHGDAQQSLLITTQLEERIFGQENPIGKSMRLGELTFTVIGVFRGARRDLRAFRHSGEFRHHPLHAHEVLHRPGVGALARRTSGAGGRRAIRRAAGGPTAAEPASDRSGVQGAIADRHSGGGRKNISLALTIVLIRDCVHCAGDQRNRDHEHLLVTVNERTDARDRNTQGHWSLAARDHVSVFDRIFRDQRRRGGRRILIGYRNTGGRAVFFAGKSAGYGVESQRWGIAFVVVSYAPRGFSSGTCRRSGSRACKPVESLRYE